MEHKLSHKEEKHILRWVGKPSWRLELLFSADRDGCDAGTFHRLCDNKGPTVMVVWNTNGWVFGGYTTKDWDTAGYWKKDDHAFMFRLKAKDKFQPIQFPGGSNAGVFGGATHGPLFGSCNAQIEYQPFDRIRQNGTFSAIHLETHQSFLKTHITGLNAATSRSEYELCNNQKDYHDCHIYSVQERTETLIEKILDKPWRKVVENWSEETKQTLKEEIAAYSTPADLDTDKVNILLLGPVGSGKSSFFNTVNSVYKGHVSARAVTGLSPHGITTKYRKYEIRNSAGGGNLKLRIGDTLGLDEKLGLDVTDVAYILDGNVPDRFQFNPLARITPGTPGFVEHPVLSEKIHVTAFVLNALDISKISDEISYKLAAIRAQVNERGVPLVILLTHIDLLLEDSEQLPTTFLDPSIQEAVETTAEKIGVPKSHILPVKNYESEIELDANVDILTLVALRQILRFSNDFFDEQMDLMEDSGAAASSKTNVSKDSKSEHLEQPN